jgi:HK97 family phage prohead protease
MTARRRSDRPTESRTFTMSEVEVREAGSALDLEGYASVFSAPYSMGWYTETVDPGSFAKTLTESPDVRLLVNHDGLPLARTRSGTLRLSTDSTGLHVAATLDPADPDVMSLVPKMKRGDLDQMSFGFRTIRDIWSEDYTERALTELSLADGDVSVVTYPASPTTSVALRSALRDGGLDLGPAPLPQALRTAVREVREGKVLSQANLDLLGRVLESLALIDGGLDAADSALDQAQADLAGLLGVANPDPDVADDTADEVEPVQANASRLALARRKVVLLGL